MWRLLPSRRVPQEEAVLAEQRRRWPRRLLIGANVFVALCLLGAAGTFVYVKVRFGQVDKVDLCKVLRNCGEDDPGQPMNVLLVGSDSRKNLTAAERRKFGTETQVGGERSDTILILHVDPRSKKAAILSVPRDLAVPIPGSGTNDLQRINTAFEGGAQRLIATLDRSLGIPIDHYAQVDFNGFRAVVEAVGGVTVYFPAPARDRVSGLDIRTPGCVQLNGERALQYVRSREYQYYESGRWHLDGTGDLGRIQRQQDFIRRVIRKAWRAGRNPVTLNSLVETAVRNVTIDRAFSTKDIARLSRRFKSLEPDAVEMLSLPTEEARVGGASVLRLKQPETRRVIDHFLGRDVAPGDDGAEPVPDIPPNRVRVRILNGTGSDREAGKAAQALQRAGFNVAGTGDADRFGYADSVVRYGRGQEDKARLLKAHVDGPTRVQEDLTLQGVDLVLITGSAFDGIRPPRGTAITTTTAPAAGATTAARPRGGPPQPPC